MLDHIHNLPINGLYDFSERYKLIKRTGDDLERDKLIEVAYQAIRVIEAGKRGKYLVLRARLLEKVSPRPSGARIFYDRKSRTTRTWDDLILAHTTAEVAADAFMAAESFDESSYQTRRVWSRRDYLKWRRDAAREMLLFRCKRVVKQPDFIDGPARIMLSWNPWIRPQCEAELADEEAQEITRALDERDSIQRHYLMPNGMGEAPEPDDDPLLSPWLTAVVPRTAKQAVRRL